MQHDQLQYGNDFLPDLDAKKTKQAVIDAFEKYRIYHYLTFEEREATITASYELRESGPTNITSDQTASIAIHNADAQKFRREYCERIERAVSKLPKMESFLIKERYMSVDHDYITDLKVYSQIFQPPISEPTYSAIRWRAFYKIALDLKLVVLKGG